MLYICNRKKIRKTMRSRNLNNENKKAITFVMACDIELLWLQSHNIISRVILVNDGLQKPSI